MSALMSYIPMLGGGAIAGFSVAFVVRKLGKYLLILAGVYLASLVYLHYKGWITINASLAQAVKTLSDLVTTKLSVGWAAAAISLPVLGAFLAGAYLGATR